MNPAHRKVNCTYGAPMGRHGNGQIDGKVHLQRVRLDSGGYDPGGAYWGIGKPLYVAFDNDGGEYYFRANNRADAKKQLNDEFVGLSFYN